MYEAFFSLEDAPFVLTPDPRFLLRSKGHHEVLSSLVYGITSQKGLMALIGDVGTGKTMLCRALLRELPKDVRSALVLNPYLSDAELLGAVLDDLGVERKGSTKGELMAVLSQYLLTAGAEGTTVVVILDEAQQMSVEALEEIRILSTLETATRKLLQIVLVGQPELEEKLQRRELRQLDQRIAIRCYLKPLSRKDTFRYIEHRMRIAGLPGALPFARGALQRIYQHSRGIPRVINLLCDRALIAAFSSRAREVTASLAKAAIENVHGERPRRRRAVPALPRALPLRAIGRVAAVAAGVLLVGAVTVTAYRAQWRPGVPQFLTRLAAATMRERQPAPRPSTASAPRPFDVPGPTPAAASPLPESRPAKIVAPGVEATGNLLARAIGLWGVSEDLSAAAVSAWPVGPDGELDVPGIASRYQLAATHLSDATLEELRAMDLPAILDMNGGSPRRPALLRRLDGTAAVLLSPSGEETRVAIGDLESSWAHSAWVIWRNVDQLPLDPIHDMTPIVLTTLALRLQKLGLLEGPMPTSYTEGFRQAVRRFQESMGIEPDGLVGPKTTLALSRVVSGRFGPSLAENAAR